MERRAWINDFNVWRRFMFDIRDSWHILCQARASENYVSFRGSGGARRTMSGIRTAIILVPLLAIGWAAQQGDVRIKWKGKARFATWEGQDLRAGATLQTTTDPVTFDYGSEGEIWIAPDTEILYEAGMILGLNYGEVVADARTGEVEIETPGLLVVAQGASASVEVVPLLDTEAQTRVDRVPPRGGGADSDQGSVQIEGDSGFRAWLAKDQSVVFVFDPEIEATRMIVPDDSPGDIALDLMDNVIQFLGGDVPLQEMTIGINEMLVPPGSDILIRKSALLEEFEAEPEREPIRRVLIGPPWGVPLPEDRPFEDSGDVLEVLNVSPSQP